MFYNILNPEDLTKLYIKILRKQATEYEKSVFKYNVTISCMSISVLFLKLNMESEKIVGKQEWNKIYDPNIERGLL